MISLMLALSLIVPPAVSDQPFWTQGYDEDWARNRLLEPAGFWRGGYVNDGFVWDGAGKGLGITVYVVDTGVAENGLIENLANGFYSFGKNTFDCGIGHGTSVASLIAGAGYGAAEAATIVPVRVLNCKGGGTRASIVKGLSWIAANADPETSVVNISFGGRADASVDAAVAKISDLGIPVVVAAGNFGAKSNKYSPSRLGCSEDLVVVVGASTWLDLPWTKSNYGNCLWIYAPGAQILTTSIDGEKLVTGTSFSAPWVSGAIAAYAAEYGVATQEALWLVMSDAVSAMTIARRLDTTDLLLQMYEGDEFVPDECVEEWWFC